MSHNKLTRATQEPAWVRRTLLAVGLGFLFFFLEIGRASCRERVCLYV